MNPQTQRLFPRRRRAIIIAAGAMFLMLGAIYYLLLRPQEPMEVAGEFSVIAAQRGPIVAAVNANGAVRPRAEAPISFAIGGVISDVLVQDGEQVRAGQTLARLRNNDLALELARAQSNLDQVMASRERLLVGARPEDVQLADAQLRVDQAQANLDRLLAWPTTADRNAAQTSLTDARRRRDSAEDTLESERERLADETASAEQERDGAQERVDELQAELDRIAEENRQLRASGAEVPPADQQAEDDARQELDEAREELQQAEDDLALARRREEAGVAQAEARLDEAERAVTTAEERRDQLDDGPDVEEIAAAQEQLRLAREKLTALQGSLLPPVSLQVARGLQGREALPSVADLSLADAQVSAAQSTYDMARLRSDQTTLRAPFDGMVTDLQLVPGTPPGPRALTLVDLGQFFVDASVDEIDIARVAAGQPVSVTLDALPGQTLPGRVRFVSPLAIQQSGATLYRVRIDLLDPPPNVRPGMSAAVTIEVARNTTALLVPRRAIKTVGQRTYVERVTGPAPAGGLPPREQVEVKTGLSNEKVIEIVSGLDEGAEVYVDGVAIDFYNLIMGQ